MLKPCPFGGEVLAPELSAVASTVMERVPASGSLLLATLLLGLDPSLWTWPRGGGVWWNVSGTRLWR